MNVGIEIAPDKSLIGAGAFNRLSERVRRSATVDVSGMERHSYPGCGTVFFGSEEASASGTTSTAITMTDHGHRVSLTDGGPLCTYSAIVGGAD